MNFTFLMDSPELVIPGLAALSLVSIGLVVLCYFKLRAQQERALKLESDLNALTSRYAVLEAELQQSDKRLNELRVQNDALQQKWQNELEAKHQVEQSKRILETQLEERQKGFEQQLSQFEEQKQALKKEFEVLANKVFEEKGKSFEEQNRTQIDAVLKPFRAQIDGFQKRVNEVHSESLKGTTHLEAQIKQVLDVGLRMSDEAKSLAQALKGDKKAQGNWGEIQVQQLLEMAGLQEGREYDREANFKSEDGKNQRPDFVINLPNDKHIIVDSKISLNSYVQAVAAETDEERAVHMRAHVDALRVHVKSLADKNYPALKGINSPEYVFMFIGNEPAYLAAADAEPALFQEAYRKGIAIVTPNTLLSSLRIVAHLWSIDKQNNHTRALADQAGKVYDKLRVFIGKMEKLGNQINTVHKSYDESWNTLTAGQGNLTRQVDKFVEMGVTVKERLPASALNQDGVEILDSE